MNQPSQYRKTKLLEARLGVARQFIAIVLMFAPMPFANQHGEPGAAGHHSLSTASGSMLLVLSTL
jgi:hypothetical protein